MSRRRAASGAASRSSLSTGAVLPSRSVSIPSTRSTSRRTRRAACDSRRCATEVTVAQAAAISIAALDRSGLRDERGDEGEGAPREREPELGVDCAAEELEVVRGDEERAEDDERNEPGGRRCGDSEPDRARSGGRDEGDTEQRPPRDRRAEWSSVELVERVRSEPEGEEERKHGEREHRPVHLGREAAAHDDVAEMPRGVGRVEERKPVAASALPPRT